MLIGVVGKANVGKSTSFKAMTLAEVDIGNFPFTTIEKNEGIGYVKVNCVDKEFNTQCIPRTGYCQEGKRFVPVKLMDVAGLVPDAHKGKGRGNQFLDDLRQADVLIHVVDISGSTNAHGEEVERGSHDPALDIRFLEVELDQWYLGILKKGWEKFARQIQQEKQNVSKALAKQLSGLGVDEDMVKGALGFFDLQDKLPVEWSETDLLNIARELRKKTKPMIIAANKMDVPGAKDIFERVQQQFPDNVIVPCSAEAELALKEAAKKALLDYVPGASTFKKIEPSKLSPQQEEALTFIEKNVLQAFGSTGVQEVLDRAVFDVLKYIAVFPVPTGKLEDTEGRVLPDCFLVPENCTAQEFAYHIHTDVGKNFIRAIDVKTKKTVGKEHILQHRDVVEIVTSK